MTALNLFPYRGHALQHQVNQFQRNIIVSAIVSVLLAIGMATFINHVDGLQPSSSAQLTHQVAFGQEFERRTGAERARPWLETIESVKLESRQRQEIISLLQTHTIKSAEGVFLGQFQWSVDGLVIDLWAASPELVSAWAQLVQTLPGLEPSYTQELLLDAAPNPLGLSTYRVRIQMDPRRPKN
jgi:hypothetical protein